MRREEAYHEKILHPKERSHEEVEIKDEIATIHNDSLVLDEALKAELIYDWQPKNSFIEHFSDEEFTLEKFKNLTFKEVGDFANQPFELNKKKNSFKRDGGIFLDNSYTSFETSLLKEYSFEDCSVTLNSKCQMRCEDKLYFAEEFNFHFAHAEKVMFNSENINNGLSLSDCDELLIKDDFTGKTLKISVNQKCKVHAFILNTIYQSESGFDRVAQGTSFIFATSFSSKIKLNFTLEILDV